MNLKTISNAVTGKLGGRVLTVHKHAPALLFGAGVVGVVATVVLASRATLKLHDVIDDAQDTLEKVANLEHATYSERDRQKDAALVYFKTATKIAGMYLPALAVGAVSIAALTGSHVILTRRNVALTAAYAAIEKGFREYRQRVVGELGEDKDAEFRYGKVERTIVEDTEQGPVTKDITVADMPLGGSIYARWFDDSCAAWQKQPQYNRLFLECQQNYANDLLRAKGWVTLNEVYEMLGMKRSQAGMVVGWVLDDGDGYIDFNIFNGESHTNRDFVNGWADRVLLDFNVDGVIFDKVKAPR
jgi:hypothetical protein